MTEFQIKDFLSYEHSAKSKDSKLTRVYFSNGDVEVCHFLQRNQQPELMKNNKWMISTLDVPDRLIEIDGNLIAELKSGSK